MKFSDFGFKENPFSITPDPRYLFLSRGHEESLAHLIYGTGPNGGFVQLTGEVGTGKTMLVRSLLEQNLEQVDIALVLNPRLSQRDFLAAICDELGIPYQGPPYQLKQINDDLNRHLLETHAQGRHTVLVIDEAQNLSPSVLEQIRLLTNLETARHKLLRIILVGQPELQQLLARKDLRQVDQRITARYHLSPLSRGETTRYIRHRLAVAGVADDLFTPAALKLVHRLTGGVPRRINTLCERALLAVFTSGAKRVTQRMVWRASREIKGQSAVGGATRWLLPGLTLLTSAALVWWGLNFMERHASQPETPAVSGVRITRLAQPEVAPSAAGSGNAGQAEGVRDIILSKEPSALPIEADATASGVSAGEVKARLQVRLFGLWGRAVGPEALEGGICRQAREVGLRCLSGSADLAGLLRLNRPFLSELNDAESSKPVLVSKLNGDELSIDDGGETSRIDRKRFLQQWRGGFVLLWQPPPEGALIGPGSSGKLVTWLRERLSLADGEPVPTVIGVDHFEDELQQRLRRFQKTQKLLTDGIAGPWTMILLNNLQLPEGTPTLTDGV